MAAIQQQSDPSSIKQPVPPPASKRSRTKPADATPEVLSVDPRTCRVWPGNQRAAERLNEERCQDLIESFLSLGHQHTPAFARVSTANDGSDYEIVAGSRRLWAATWVRENHRPDFQFRIKLLGLSDEEACWLSDSENRERDDVSDYERALAYKHVLAAYYNSQVEMATRYNMTESKLSRYLRLAELPVQIANAFSDWPDLKIYYAPALLKLLRQPGAAKKILKKATELHIVHEERALADKTPLTGKQVFTTLLAAAKTQRGGARGPVREFATNDRTHLRVTACNKAGIAIVVPHNSGASIDDIVSSFRACLEEFHEAQSCKFARST
jgi:ParB family chromosome partitioning protein